LAFFFYLRKWGWNFFGCMIGAGALGTGLTSPKSEKEWKRGFRWKRGFFCLILSLSEARFFSRSVTLSYSWVTCEEASSEAIVVAFSCHFES
jgi:hypothetical protein